LLFLTEKWALLVDSKPCLAENIGEVPVQVGSCDAGENFGFLAENFSVGNLHR
jgi:hypothetical protein